MRLLGLSFVLPFLINTGLSFYWQPPEHTTYDHYNDYDDQNLNDKRVNDYYRAWDYQGPNVTRNISEVLLGIGMYDMGGREEPAWVTYPVDMDMISSNWPLFYSKFCGRVCDNGSLVLTIERCTKPKCFPCECDERCVFRGTCCPSFYEIKDNNTIYDKSDKFNGNYLGDAFNRVRCLKSYSKKKFLALTSCPDTWTDQTIRQQCEGPSGDSLDSVTRYIDNQTGLVFRNIYCVVCNGFVALGNNSNTDISTVYRHDRLFSTRFTALEFTVECAFYDQLFHVTDVFEFYQTAVFLPECIVDLYLEQHSACESPVEEIDNTHMAWDACPPHPNSALRDLCHVLPPAPALVVAGVKNIFCYLCQEPDLFYVNDSEACLPSPVITPPSPSKLLFSPTRKDQDKDSREKLTVCDSNPRGDDEQDECLEVSCSAGKVLTPDEDRCEASFTEIRGLNYLFRVTLISLSSIPEGLQHQFVNSVQTILKQQTSFVKSGYSLDQSTCVFGDTQGGYHTETQFDGYIFSSMSLSRDEFEHEVLRAMFISLREVQMYDGNGNTFNVSLRHVCAGREMCDIYHGRYKPFDCSVDKTKLENIDYFYETPQIIQEISTILLCPHVSLDLIGKPTVVDRNIKVTIDLNGQKGRMTWDPLSMSYEKGKIQMCVDVYRNISNVLEKEGSAAHSIVSVIHYYLDTVCNFVSCAFLMVCIMIYLMFPSLRTLPGLNTLCLCLCLLTAQLSLLVTSLFGTTGFLTEDYCFIHAIILHYSWVASFVWMSTCCVHMYRVFTGIKIQYRLRNFTMYCLYSFGLPVLVVVLTVVVTALTTDGRSIGYDRHTCFLDTSHSSLILIFGLLVPLLFSATSNVVLFTLTMKTIVSMTRMQVRPKSNHGVVTYVKLSTVTGFFCLFTAIAIQFDSPVLSLLASPFAALQGLFVFVSFIANKRVYELVVYSLSNKKQSIPSERGASLTTKF